MSLFSEWNLVSPVRACCPQVCDNSKGKKKKKGFDKNWMIILKDVVYVGIGDNIILPCQVSGIIVMKENKMSMTKT